MGKRITFLFTILLFLLSSIIVRLFFWQVASFDVLKGLAEQQTLSTVSIPAQRGKIFSSDGSPLVLNQKSFLVYAEPQKIQDLKRVESILAKELEISPSSVSAKLSTSSKWIPIARKIDETKVEVIKKVDLPGIGFLEESKRYYSESSMAAHLLGFVGKNAKGEDKGYFGIEGFYDEQLRGKSGILRQEEDAKGIPIFFGKMDEVRPEYGRDLYLTIDKTIQFIAENKLKEGLERYGAKGGTAVVMDPQTGAILAMAAFPSYDPVKIEEFPAEFYKNPIVASSYEPGSTFKVLVMAAALNEGKIKPETTYKEDGPVEIGEYSIKTWNQKYHGEINIPQILEYSSNVGMVFVEKELGKDLFLRYIEDMGFGSLTDIDLQEESSPLLRPKKKWTEIDYATASFGQGIAVTPLQMIRAVAAVANGGKLMHPFIVKAIKTEKGKMIKIAPKVDKEIFKKETTAVVAEMMVSAVNNGETRFIKPQGYRIAGKTGTAQIPIAGHYDQDKTIASFVGFAPTANPKFIMLVTVVEPTASPWGSETAAPIFFAIAKELFAYFGVSSSE